MSYAVRAPVSDLAVTTALPIIEGKSGETQRRSSRLSLGAVSWRSNSVVSCGQVTAPPPENRESGSAPRERPKMRLSPCSRTRPTASRSVTAGSLTRVASESMSSVNGFRSGVAISMRAKRAVRSLNSTTRRSPSGDASITRPGLARSAASALSRRAAVRSERSGFQGSAIRSVPPFTFTSWKSISGEGPPPGPFLSPSTSS